MILYDIISEAGRQQIKAFMPKSWRVKRPKAVEVAVEMAVKVTELDVKDMAKKPQGK